MGAEIRKGVTSCKEENPLQSEQRRRKHGQVSVVGVLHRQGGQEAHLEKLGWKWRQEPEHCFPMLWAMQNHGQSLSWG